ncbi:sulfotransferase [Thecamonas trahens ATCC 50062]|uniref:Sulfotransferase n=1 Tax=Thecamonas trahens ATCC 50062 TaxID=461836 RepID=A0A0L0D5F5_THETB|nr:sulfotransferase [Thecamonas trahens ATCC 50062]KNC47445.1 sulfotransferase [Thecamonas trahens ATCC 50062]|eukprot:XP_013759382.1 sulfotransferase [Thecamonas trahens ATCC 50062]
MQKVVLMVVAMVALGCLLSLLPSSKLTTPPTLNRHQSEVTVDRPKTPSPRRDPPPRPQSVGRKYVLLHQDPLPTAATWIGQKPNDTLTWNGAELPFCYSPEFDYPDVLAYRDQHVCMPSFNIIGTLKGGTSSMYTYMQNHPAVYSPFKKELCWFRFVRIPGSDVADPDMLRRRLPLIPRANEHGITGLGCPFYLADYGVSELVKEIFPRLRLIVMLRNPIDRLYSMFNMRVRYTDDGFTGREKFEDFVRCQRGSHGNVMCTSDHEGTRDFIYESMYVLHFRRWIRDFPLSPQWIIIDSAEFYADEEQTMRKVFAHLGLPPFDFPNGSFRPINADPQKAHHIMDPKLRGLLDEFYAPYSEQLYDLLDYDFGWHDTDRLNARRFPFNELFHEDGTPSNATYTLRDDPSIEDARFYRPPAFGVRPKAKKPKPRN